MLREADVQAIQETYKIPGLLDAFKAQEEKEVAVPKHTVLEETELTNLKNSEYNRGKTAGVEMAVKEYKDATGLEFTGKTIDGLVKAANAKALADANIAPDQKVAELNKTIEQLQKNYTTLEQQVQAEKETASKASTLASIISAIPTLGDNALPVPKVLRLMESDGYEFRSEDGKTVVYLNNEKVADQAARVIPIADVIRGYAKDNKLVFESAEEPQKRGRGASDDKLPGTFTKLSEVNKWFDENGKSKNGEEYMMKVQELRKDNPSFDMEG